MGTCFNFVYNVFSTIIRLIFAGIFVEISGTISGLYPLGKVPEMEVSEI